MEKDQQLSKEELEKKYREKYDMNQINNGLRNSSEYELNAQPRYANGKDAMNSLKQLYEISQTEQGMIFLEQCQSYLIEVLNEKLQFKVSPFNSGGYCNGQLDEMHLKIYKNLIKNKHFIMQARKRQYEIEQFRNYPYSVNFCKGMNEILYTLDNFKDQEEIQEKQMLNKKIEQLKTANMKNSSEEKNQSEQQAMQIIEKDFLNYVLMSSQQERKERFLQYLSYITELSKTANRNQVLHLFPKGCGGCLLFCLTKWGYLYKELDKVFEFFKVYMTDPYGVFIERNGLDMLAQIIRSTYPIKDWNRSIDDVNGCCCLDLRLNKQYPNAMEQFDDIGTAFNNQEFLDYFSKDPIAVNKEMENYIIQNNLSQKGGVRKFIETLEQKQFQQMKKKQEQQQQQQQQQHQQEQKQEQQPQQQQKQQQNQQQQNQQNQEENKK